MSGPTPVIKPSIDQQVNYFSTTSSAPIPASIVNIWDDGPVDVVVTDPNQPNQYKVTRIPYAPYGQTATPLNQYDQRYVAQITTGSGLPIAAIQNTNPTEDGPAQGPGTEPLST